MRSFYTLFTLLISFSLLAQEQHFFGKVVDEQGKAIPLVNFVIKKINKGFAADNQGEFNFHLSMTKDQTDTLIISCIGFRKHKIVLSSTTSQQACTITLSPDVEQLPPITVSAKAAENLVRKAIKNIASNYPQEPYLFKSFYRQRHKEDNRNVRLIEAAVDIYDPGYQYRMRTHSEERFRITALRRSNVYEKNKDQHGDHLYDLMQQNPIRHTVGSFLNETWLDHCHFYFADEPGNYHPDSIAVIAFLYKDKLEKIAEEGKLYINKTDYAIIGLELKQFLNPDYKPDIRSSNHHNWKFKEGSKTVRFKKSGAYYYLDQLSYYYRHFIFDESFNYMKHDTEEFFDLWVAGHSEVSKDFYPKKHFRSISSLYRRPYTYDASFWVDFPLLKQHPIDHNICKELETEEVLDVQFRKNAAVGFNQ